MGGYYEIVDVFEYIMKSVNKKNLLAASIVSVTIIIGVFMVFNLKQEKQIDKVITITAGTYGDLRGLIGSSMQSIPALEAGDESDIEKPEVSAEITAPVKIAPESTPAEEADIDPKDIPF